MGGVPRHICGQPKYAKRAVFRIYDLFLRTRNRAGTASFKKKKTPHLAGSSEQKARAQTYAEASHSIRTDKSPAPVRMVS